MCVYMPVSVNCKSVFRIRKLPNVEVPFKALGKPDLFRGQKMAGRY